MPISNYFSAQSALLVPYMVDQFQRDFPRVQGSQLPFFKTRLCKEANCKTEPVVMPSGPASSQGHLSHSIPQSTREEKQPIQIDQTVLCHA